MRALLCLWISSLNISEYNSERNWDDLLGSAIMSYNSHLIIVEKNQALMAVTRRADAGRHPVL